MESLEPRRLLAATDVILSEVMYHTTADNDDGLEYVELFNRGTEPVDLTGWRLQDDGDNVLHTIAGATIGPGAYLLVAADVDNHSSLTNVVGETSDWADGGLGNGGDSVLLFAADDTLIADLTYTDSAPWPERADGNGSSLQIADLFADVNELYNDDNWMASLELGGSPGVAGLTGTAGVVINEVLANADRDVDEVDRVELHNTTGESIDIAGWFLTDLNEFETGFRRFSVPHDDPRAVIPPLGYVVFDETDFDADRVGLDNEGDVLSLLSTGTGQPTVVTDTVVFPASETSVSFGRLPNGSGDLFPTAEQTFGDANTAHRQSPVVISEVNYHPTDMAGVENEDLEYIELHNQSDAPVDLTTWRLQPDVEFDFPANTIVQPDARLLVVRFDPPVDTAKRSAFEAAYGLTIGNGAGQVQAVGSDQIDNMSNRRGTIELREEVDIGTPANPLDAYVLRDAISYADRGEWPERPDGDGSSLIRSDSSAFGGLPETWLASAEFGGSPGGTGLGASTDVAINEVLSHTDLPQVDSIELMNLTDQPIDLGGWYLSDEGDTDTPADRLQYEIPAGTILPANGYLVFNAIVTGVQLEADSNDSAWLVQADAGGAIERFVDAVEFGASFNGESFGRVPNGAGELFTNTTVTLGDENSDPKFGPVIITELVYNPAGNDDFEFVELYNTSQTGVNLNPASRLAHPTGGLTGGGWHLDGVDFDFPLDFTLPAGGFAVVVSFDPADTTRSDAFRAAYGIDASVTLLGPFVGRLDNSGESVQVLLEDDSPLDLPPAEAFLPLVVRDEVSYGIRAPWPEQVVGTQRSLFRASPDAYGNFAENWAIGTPTPGSAEPLAEDDRATTGEDEPIEVALLQNDAGVLAALDPATVVITSVPAHGSVAVDPLTGRATYTPDDDYYGDDTFRYTVDDAQGATSNEAVVSIEIASRNDPPTAADDDYAVDEDSLNNTFDVLDGDTIAPDVGETLSISEVGTPDQGGAAVIVGGQIEYTPLVDFFGEETFTYTIDDGNGASDQATVTVEVRPINDDPTAVDDQALITGNTAGNVLDVLANDTIDPDVGETLTIENVSGADQGGTVSVADGALSLTYAPAVGFAGTETFSYTISDGNGGSDTATVTIEVSENPTPWLNPVESLDVNDDTSVSPLDALVIINRLNSIGAGPLDPPSPTVAPPPYYDTSGDNFVAPIDALLVINELNRRAAEGAPEGEPGRSETPLQVSPGAASLTLSPVTTPMASATQPAERPGGDRNVPSQPRPDRRPPVVSAEFRSKSARHDGKTARLLLNQVAERRGGPSGDADRTAENAPGAANPLGLPALDALFAAW